MRARSLILIFTVAFVFVYSLCYITFVWLKTRPIKPHPLPLKIVEWTSKFQVREAFAVDLDADGCGELLVEDEQGRLWWAKWGGKQLPFEQVPFSSKEFIRMRDWRRLPQLLVGSESNFIWLITRSGSSWEKVRIPIKGLPPPPISWPIENRASLLDLDGDGKCNDVLVLSDTRKLEWWQRKDKGKIRLKDCLDLPRECTDLLDAREGRGWKVCRLTSLMPTTSHISSVIGPVSPVGAPPIVLPNAPSPPPPPMTSYAFVTVENNKLRWKGAWAEDFRWIDVDIDGNGMKERIEWWEWRNGRNELVIQFAKGELQVLTLPQKASALIEDLDGDGQSEILVYDYTKGERVGVMLWQFDRKESKWHQKCKEFIPTQVVSFSPFFPYSSRIIWDKPQSSDWSLLITTKQSDRFQLERWQVSKKGWQSECIAVLPEPEIEETWLLRKEDCLRVIWTGYELVVVEKRFYPLWLTEFRRLFRQALSEIGLKSLEDRPLPSPPSRIWGWHPQKQRWLLLGYIFSYEIGDLLEVTLFGSGSELAIIWCSSLDSVNVGVFRNGVWQVNRLTTPLNGEMTRRLVLWDGSQYWTILYDGKNFVAFAELQPKAK
ncbi:hypothetical protein GG496_001121 [Candidatus Fervidibacteria bacterium JGI MDM2 JNZ-1-D12]